MSNVTVKWYTRHVHTLYYQVDQIKDGIGEACDTNGRDDICTQNFGHETRREETICGT
jgi:hypothetical protein